MNSEEAYEKARKDETEACGVYCLAERAYIISLAQGSTHDHVVEAMKAKYLEAKKVYEATCAVSDIVSGQ